MKYRYKKYDTKAPYIYNTFGAFTFLPTYSLVHPTSNPPRLNKTHPTLNYKPLHHKHFSEKMASFATSASSLTPVELSDISINTCQLAIVASLFPRPLLPRLLTPTHIAAIQIHTHHADPSFSVEHINGATIANDTIKIIRLARAYAEYYNNLSMAQRRERTIYENYRMLGWGFIEGMDIFVFEECIENCYFLERLELGGEEVHREMLEAGWRAYEQVPRHVKLALGLLFRDEDDGEGMVSGVNGVNGRNGFH